ncbi:MAG TPA: uroporphyrinogen-III synthase [Phenylobacterium sp.]|nr:uroporphyrinogen-III synthase [Phenylobacterium sp.]
MAGRRQRIWITRTRPGADSTAERVRALGHEALIAPLLSVRPVEDATVDLKGVGALAFTSANGVRAFTELCGERELRVFAVGAATAQAARAAGFHTVLSADGDVEALAEGIASRRGQLRGAVLHPGAAEPAGDLAGALEKHGVQARRAILYETGPVKLDEAQARSLSQADAALLHSPAAAKALASVLRAHPAPQMRALGLSKAVIRPLSRIPMAGKAYPPFPLEAALLNLIDRGA